MHTYSRRWYETFLHGIPQERTDPEVAFLMRRVPLDTHRRILDVCCGAGRHSAPLAEAGYRVTGVDVDQGVLAAARRIGPDNPRYLLGDMRALPLRAAARFDAALIMWQSWGQFASAENDRVLEGLASRLRSGGLLILDLYHRDFFERHQGVREREVAGRHIVETKTMNGTHLTVELSYDGAPTDRFEWELVTPAELHQRTRPLGLQSVLDCAGFDESVDADGAQPRFQAVLRRA